MPKAASKSGSTAKTKTKTTAKRASAAKAAPVRRKSATPARKSAPAKTVVPVKKATPAKKATPVKKAKPAKRATPRRTPAPKVAVKQKAPAKATSKKSPAAAKSVTRKKATLGKAAAKPAPKKTPAPKVATKKPAAAAPKAAPSRVVGKAAAPARKAVPVAEPLAEARPAAAAPPRSGTAKRATHRPSSGARRPLAMRESARTAQAQSAPLPTPRKRVVKVGTFEQLIAPFPMQVQTLCMALRELVGRALPEARETIFPAVRVAIFEARGPIGFIEPRRDHARLYFTRGVELEDQDKLLQSGGKPFPYVKLWHLDTLQAPALRALLQSAESLNRSKPVGSQGS
jgi:hypothetical protein